MSIGLHIIIFLLRNFQPTIPSHKRYGDDFIPARSNIVPHWIEKKGKRTYVMMQPYVREPNLTLTIGLYNKPKQYADQNSAIGEVIGSKREGFKEVQVG